MTETPAQVVVAPSLPNGTTVSIHRRVLNGVDEFGDDKYTDVATDVYPCSVQPGSSVEVIQGTEQLTSDIVVYVPAGTDVDAIDFLMIGGVKYEIQGSPNAGISPFTGFVPPVQIRANVVTGVSV